jgi:hypothetical protein
MPTIHDDQILGRAIEGSSLSSQFLPKRKSVFGLDIQRQERPAYRRQVWDDYDHPMRCVPTQPKWGLKCQGKFRLSVFNVQKLLFGHISPSLDAHPNL